MPVINIPYVAKGAAHAPIRPIQPIKPMPSATIDTRNATTGPRQRPSQDAILAAMQSAMTGRVSSSGGFGTTVDLNRVEEPPPVLRDATDSINDYTRARIREQNVYRRIMPPLPIDNPGPSFLEPSPTTFLPADRIAYVKLQEEADLAAQEAVRIQLPLGPRQIIRDVNKKTQE